MANGNQQTRFAPGAVVPDGSGGRSGGAPGVRQSMVSKRKSQLTVPKHKPPSPKQEAPVVLTRMDLLKQKSRALTDNWRFAVLTTALTFYALFGDDFRLALTSQNMDPIFDAITIICILVFGFEIVASSLGTEGYFMGFFFVLDVGSTLTLVLDIGIIGRAIFCQEGEGEGALRTGRAGRAGARASRTVRIIRLMRLAKLYKAYRTSLENKKAMMQSKRRESNVNGRQSMMGRGSVMHNRDDMRSSEMGAAPSILPGEEADELEGDHAEEGEQPQFQGRASVVGAEGLSGGGGGEDSKKKEEKSSETRVGKKLSDMTTRRVIILVLIMLFVMPQFTPSNNGDEDYQLSSNFGTDVVYERWRTYCGDKADLAKPWCFDLSPAGNGSLVMPDDDSKTGRQHDRTWFENALMNFVYQHHKGDGFAYRLFWVGVNSANPAVDKDYLSKLFRMNQPSLTGKTYAVDEWDAAFVRWPPIEDNNLLLSEAVKQKLMQPWGEECLSFVGTAVGMSSDMKEDCSTSHILRCTEREYASPLRLSSGEREDLGILFTFDIRTTTTLEAGLSMLQTIFICLAVGVGAMSFSKDANELLLNPIERMIAKMETIKDNPLEAMRLGDLEYRREEIRQARHKEELAQMGRCWKLVYRYKYMKKMKEPMETVMLEKTIIKLGGLLALGFGEAGAEIVSHNMHGSTVASVNALVPGHKVDVILAFCTLRNFVTAMDVLKEKVMLFVNQVGEIVHGCADDYHGAPNKNLGETFMLVWRLTGLPPERQLKIADMSVLSIVKMVAEVNKSRVLALYRRHPALLQHVKEFRVQLGFGLHCGWAIEGAIGSEFKIDAAYVSPNVQVTAKMQEATPYYGVWILISHFMVHHCSKELALLCRLIDHTLVKGARHPIRLYTFDLDAFSLEVNTKVVEPVTRNRFKIRQLREVRKNEKFLDDYNVFDVFNTDEDLIAMRAKFSKEFFHRFSMAYRNYEAGEWMAARDMLYTCFHRPRSDLGRHRVTVEAGWPKDGPVVTLLRFMQSFDYSPPADWPGYRMLPCDSDR